MAAARDGGAGAWPHHLGRELWLDCRLRAGLSHVYTAGLGVCRHLCQRRHHHAGAAGGGLGDLSLFSATRGAEPELSAAAALLALLRPHLFRRCPAADFCGVRRIYDGRTLWLFGRGRHRALSRQPADHHDHRAARRRSGDEVRRTFGAVAGICGSRTRLHGLCVRRRCLGGGRSLHDRQPVLRPVDGQFHLFPQDRRSRRHFAHGRRGILHQPHRSCVLTGEPRDIMGV